MRWLRTSDYRPIMVDGCGGGRKRASDDREVKARENLTAREENSIATGKRESGRRAESKREQMTEEANEAAVNYAGNETQQATASGVDGLAELKTGPTTP